MNNAIKSSGSVLLFLLLIGINSCKKDKPALPNVLTTTVTDISQTSATSGGEIIDEGGTFILSRGVCWSTSSDPTIANIKTSQNGGSGSFISLMTQLTPDTKYYIRAYATNNAGTGYGNQESFTTSQVAVATLTTTEITSVTQNSAISGGNIITDNGLPVTSRGVCWSRTANPTISDSITTDGGGTGIFTSSISGLKLNTQYYIRAYAINDEGVSYGNEISLTTLDYGSVTDIDGNVYKTFNIGTQVWMIENLKVTHYRNGDPIFYPGTDNSAWLLDYNGAYAWYQNDEVNYKDAYAAAYNWYAVINNAGLCPTGWHVPAIEEWRVLIKTLDPDFNQYNSPESLTAGGKLMSTRMYPDEHPRWNAPNSVATNESGFSALPTPVRNPNFDPIGLLAIWWSSTPSTPSGGHAISITQNWNYVYESWGGTYYGKSVRCLKDN